jgi:hypothetical protein
MALEVSGAVLPDSVVLVDGSLGHLGAGGHDPLVVSVRVLDSHNDHGRRGAELPRRPVAVTRRMQPDDLVTGAHLGVDYVALAVVLDGAGGEAEHAHEVFVRCGEVVVNEKDKSAAYRGIGHGHLLDGGQEIRQSGRRRRGAVRIGRRERGRFPWTTVGRRDRRPALHSHGRSPSIRRCTQAAGG